MYNKIKGKWNNYFIERIKKIYPNPNSYIRTRKLAKYGEPQAVKELEIRYQEIRKIIEKQSKQLHKMRFEEFSTGIFSHPPSKREINDLEDIFLEEDYSYEDISRMIYNAKNYRRSNLLFILTIIGTIITIISAIITVVGLLIK